MSKMRLRLKAGPEQCAMFSLVMFLCYEPLVAVFNFMPSIITSLIVYFIIYFPLFVSFFLSKKIPWDFFALLGTVVAIFAVTYYFHPEYYQWFFTGYYRLTRRIFRPDRYLYAYLFVRSVKEPKNVLKALKYAAMILLLHATYRLIHALSVGYWITNTTGVDAPAPYDLNYGYGHLLIFSIFIITAFREKKKKYYLLAAISILEVFLGGSRGPILFMFVMIAILYIYKIQEGNSTRKTLLTGAGICLAVFVFYLGTDGIMKMIGSFLSTLGLGNTRTVQNLLAGTITDDNGRSPLYMIAVDMIRQNGLFGLGYGAYGDRYVIGATYIWVGYCHNIVLELMIDYGFILGSLATIYIVVNSIKMLFMKDENDWRDLFLVFFIASLKLIFSGSYWYSETFFAAIAVCVGYRIYKREKTDISVQ